MHHVYGDGVSGPRVLPRPGVVPPDFDPFPGGNPLRPTLRSNFRLAGGLDADPIHLTAEGYRHKAGQQIWAHLLRVVVPEPDLRVQSSGGAADGWTDGSVASGAGLVVGDDGVSRVVSILGFDLAAMPSNATITGATLWLTREGGQGTNPFTSGLLGSARLDVAVPGFGTANVVEPNDATATADFADVGTFVGNVTTNGATLRVDVDPAALAGAAGLEVRLAFDSADALVDRVDFADGDAGEWTPVGTSTFAETLGSAAPVLELRWELGTSTPPLAASVLGIGL